MARYMEPTPEQVEGWEQWKAGLNPKARAIADRFDPWSLYRLPGPNGHRCSLVSIDEPADGGPCTLKVRVTGEWNFLTFSRVVFGVRPDDLVLCDDLGSTGSHPLPTLQRGN